MPASARRSHRGNARHHVRTLRGAAPKPEDDEADEGDVRSLDDAGRLGEASGAAYAWLEAVGGAVGASESGAEVEAGDEIEAADEAEAGDEAEVGLGMTVTESGTAVDSAAANWAAAAG